MSPILPGRFAAFLVGLCWPFVVAAEPDSWTSQTGMPTARVFHGACSANDRLYVFGGQTMGGGAGIASVEEYDPATDSWRARADMPAPSLGMSVSEVGGKCYLAGGASAPGGVALDTVYEYDPATNGWRGVADMPTARVAAASAVIDGLIYVVGGWTSGNIQSPAVASTDVYDPQTDSWNTVADLPDPRAMLAAASIDGRLYAIGGGSVALGAFDTQRVHRYDPGTDTWSVAPSLLTARGALAAGAVGRRIVVAGGDFDSPGLSSVELYDPMAGSWTAVADMPTARWAAAGAVLNGRLWVTGGSTQSGGAHNSVTTNAAYQAPFRINPGLNDAWYQQATSGQGFFVIVLPDAGIVFMAWFTFDTQRPPQDIDAILGEPGHRWLTAQGPYSGDTAVLDVILSQGGVFDAGSPKPENSPIGTITIVWDDCESATLSYQIDPPGVSGVIPITRIVPDNVALCRALDGM